MPTLRGSTTTVGWGFCALPGHLAFLLCDFDAASPTRNRPCRRRMGSTSTAFQAGARAFWAQESQEMKNQHRIALGFVAPILIVMLSAARDQTAGSPGLVVACSPATPVVAAKVVFR